MHIFTQIKATLVVLFLLIFVLIPTCLVAIPFNLKRRLKIVCPVWAWSMKFALRYACDTQIVVAEDQRSPEIRTIPAFGLYIANHQSYIDIPLIITMYQVPPIMKKEVLYIPFVGLLGWICGAMPVSRTSSGSRKKVFDQTKRRILGDRIGVQVYPEGTRSKDATPKQYNEIKRPLMVFAYNEKIPVIPTSIYGTRGVLTPQGLIDPGKKLGIIVHHEIYPENFATAEDFCRACWSKVQEGHHQMKARIAPGSENLSLV